MSYWDEVAAVVSANRAEIEADLKQARDRRNRLGVELSEADRQVAVFERLLVLLDGETAVRQNASALTLHEAMRVVLSGQPGHMMRAGDLAQGIADRGLYRMRNGRPAEAQQIHARVGNYPNLFEREGTFIKLI